MQVHIAESLLNILINADDYAEASSTLVASTSNGETAADPTSMHFSQTAQYNAYNYSALSAITCGAGGTDSGTAGTMVSDQMLSLGGYVLVHELTWVKAFSPYSADGFGSRAFLQAYIQSSRRNLLS